MPLKECPLVSSTILNNGDVVDDDDDVYRKNHLRGMNGRLKEHQAHESEKRKKKAKDVKDEGIRE